MNEGHREFVNDSAFENKFHAQRLDKVDTEVVLVRAIRCCSQR